MNSLNKCQFIGNLGKDPEVRVIGEQQTKVAQFSVACSDSYQNKAGEKVEATEWVNVVAWGKLAEIIEKFVHKGDKIYVCGKMVTRSYDAQDGTKKYITEIKADEILMLSGKPSADQHSSVPYQSAVSPNTAPERIKKEDEDPSDLPF